ncbi:MAG TPA: nucleoside deaminase, partial [Jiangellaceae bacterium]|nr:nucleoside deaminase [Jiangellaceae bacterium]
AADLFQLARSLNSETWRRHTIGTTVTSNDERFLRRAIELAAVARAAGDAPFGSLLVGPDGTVLREDRNTVLSDGDITAHPELKLAKWAARELESSAAVATTMYTSCQPCSMCAGAIDRSGLGRVVFALSNEQLADLKPSGGFPRVNEEGPFLFEEARIPVDGYYH